MPDTRVDSIVVTPDPCGVAIVGMTARELNRLGPMDPDERAAARAAVDPLLLTTI